MGLDDGQRRAAELEAYQALWNLWRSSRRSAADVDNWGSACRLLQTYYTVARARRDAEVCAMRMRYLEISEPVPRLADFVHAPPRYRLPDAPPQLAQAMREFRLARQLHPGRERQRLRELETTRALYEAVKAAEARARTAEVARRREWQKSRWPKDVVLESGIYDLDSLAAQVESQNAKIESRMTALTGLLRDGLLQLGDPAQSDAAGIAAHVESVLTAMPLPRGMNPKATVTYSADTRQLVVEYELPTVDVVPKAKSYRYVKSRQMVTETARPASQVKALYASIIAQLTLLSLAAIVKLDSGRHIDNVVFTGVVDARDAGSGQPIRPCLIAVRAARDTIADIDFAEVDPPACLKRLSAAVSRNPTQFVPVPPLSQ